MPKTVVVALEETPYRAVATAGRHVIMFDEPESLGGGGTAPEPSDALLAALGSCSLITMKMYAARKNWDLQTAAMELSKTTERTPDGQRAVIRRLITLGGNLTDEQRERLMQIAMQCPVARLLTGEVVIESELAPARGGNAVIIACP